EGSFWHFLLRSAAVRHRCYIQRLVPLRRPTQRLIPVVMHLEWLVLRGWSSWTTMRGVAEWCPLSWIRTLQLLAGAVWPILFGLSKASICRRYPGFLRPVPFGTAFLLQKSRLSSELLLRRVKSLVTSSRHCAMVRSPVS